MELRSRDCRGMATRAWGPVRKGAIAEPPMTNAESDALGRARVDLALAGVVTLFLSPLFSWTIVLAHPAANAGPWRRRLVGLAVVDTVVWVCFLFLFAHLRGAPSHHLGLDLARGPGWCRSKVRASERCLTPRSPRMGSLC